jgi:hypothetical protein
MSEQNEAALMADRMQADYFRAFLHDQRADLIRRRGAHIARLNESLNTGSSRLVSHHRASIRTTENELRSVDGMIARLQSRFPEKARR